MSTAAEVEDYCDSPIRVTMWRCLFNSARLPSKCAVTAEWVETHMEVLKQTLKDYKAEYGFAPCPNNLFKSAYYRTPVGLLEVASEAAETNRVAATAKKQQGTKRFLSRFSSRCQHAAKRQHGDASASTSVAGTAVAAAGEADEDHLMTPVMPGPDVLGGTGGSDEIEWTQVNRIGRDGTMRGGGEVDFAARSGVEPPAQPDLADAVPILAALTSEEAAMVHWAKSLRDHSGIELGKSGPRASHYCNVCVHGDKDLSRLRAKLCLGLRMEKSLHGTVVWMLHYVRKQPDKRTTALKYLVEKVKLP